MAFSFTLPELRAELRALGHDDGLPDHVILNFLSELNLPLPCSSAPASHSSSTSLDSSGYDSDASFCSTHSLSCGCGSPKESVTCAGDGAFPSVELVDGHPQNQISCQESESLRNSKMKLRPLELSDGVSAGSDPWRVTACTLAEAPSSNGNGRHTVRHCQKSNSSRSSEFARIERGRTSLQHAGNHKPDAGCEARYIPHSEVRQEIGKEASPDKMIEHYWISVGEEHMRAMHSRRPNKEQLKSLPAMELKHATSAAEAREGKIGYGSLIEKVEQCEGELQRLTLRLQAQQCKRPWFLEAARKPRALQMEKYDVKASNIPIVNSSNPETMQIEQYCTDMRQLSVVSVHSTQTSVEIPIEESHIVNSSDPETMQTEQCTDRRQLSVIPAHSIQTSLEIPRQGHESLSLIVQESREAPCENLEVSKGRSKQLVDKEIAQPHTLETQPAGTFSASECYELEKSGQHQDQKDVGVQEDVAVSDLGLDRRDEPDPSVCSKSSSASYHHSRSSGDSGSNVSQQVSARLSSRRRPCSTSQQPRRRGGKIDRVARFAEMQRVWKKDAFLVANEAGGKRKRIQGFHHYSSNLHSTRSY